MLSSITPRYQMLHVESAKHMVAILNQFDGFGSKLPNALRQVLINLTRTSRTGSPVPASCSHQIHCSASPGVFENLSAELKTRIGGT